MKKRLGVFILLLIAVIFALTGCDLFSDKKILPVETKYYTITVNEGQGGGSYEQGAAVTLTPSTIEGKVFSCWKVGNAVVSESAEYIFTAYSDLIVTAVYIDAIKVYKVTTVQVSQMYIISGLGDYEQGSEVTVIANQAPYLVFLHWTANGVIVSSDSNYSFTINENTEVNPIYDYCSTGLVFEYDEFSDSYFVTDYTEKANYDFTVTIPAHYNDGMHGLKLVTQVSDNALELTNKMTKVTIGEGVKKLGKRAFFGCSDLTQVILPDSLISIGEECFSGNFKLNNVRIPKNVSEIQDRAFSRTSDLDNFTVDNQNQHFKAENGVLFSKNGDTLVKYPQGKAFNADYTISSNVTNIGRYAFDEVYLNSVLFQSGAAITEIGSYAFYKSHIKKFTVPKSVNTVKNNAFSQCFEFTDFKFESGSQLTTIESYAFYNCLDIQGLNLPEGLEEIQNNAFEGCISLIISLPKSLQTIGDNAFKNCTSITDIFIGEFVTSIGETAFLGCNIYFYVYIASSIIIENLSATAYGGLAANASLIYVNSSYNKTLLPAYITENYTLSASNQSYSLIYFDKYSKIIKS